MELLSREDWLGRLAESVGATLLKNGLEPADDLSAMGGRDLTAALIVASVASAHSHGHLLDEVVERVVRGGWMADGVDHGDVAISSISSYRSGEFPGPKWWDALTLDVSLLESWADVALGSSSRSKVEDVLRNRWRVDERAVQVLAEGLGQPEAEPVAEIESRARDSRRIASLLASEKAVAAMSRVEEGLPDHFADHRRLVGVSRSLGFLIHLDEVLKAFPADDLALAEMTELRNTIKDAARKEMMRLSLLEGSAFEAPSKSRELLRESVEATRRQIHIAELGVGIVIPNGLSDRFEDATLVADYLTDHVFSAGGRSGLLAWGPTAYMWLALERHEVPRNRSLEPLGLGVPREGELPFELQLQIAADEENPLTMNYRVGASDEGRRWLAMLALSGQIMIDVFEIDPDGSLNLLLRSAQPMPELVDQLKSKTVRAIEGAKPSPLFTGYELDEHVISGFGLSENAKSELLLAIRDDADGADEVAGARRALLDAQVDRADALFAGDDPTVFEHRVDDALAAYGDARSRAISGAHGDLGNDPIGHHRDLVADIARDGRAIVHYNFRNNHIEGFWTANGGNLRGWIAGEKIDVGALTSAVRPWLIGPHGDVDVLLEAARPVAAELHEALAGTGVEEILVIPWSVLNGVPFGAIPLEDSILGDRYRISYAPSLGLLRPLVARGASPREAIELVAAHGFSLEWADIEIEAAKAIYPSARTTTDGSSRDDVLAAMGRGRIVHLATHGQSWRDDPFASSLDLRSASPRDGHISAAAIYRDVDLSGAELVTLSACDTGRSPSARHGIEIYSGLDAAFLAKGSRAVVSTLWPINDLAAMLFMTNLHAELAGGAAVADAFDLSVDLLRSGILEDLPRDHQVSTALSAVGVDWRAATERSAGRFKAPAIWAAFKLSGVPWLSKPLPDDSLRRVR